MGTPLNLELLVHELRAPLNAILGFTQLMQLDRELPKRQRRYLVSMQQSGEHLVALVGDTTSPRPTPASSSSRRARSCCRACCNW